MNPVLREKLGRLPREPGCYLMKDAKGVIIYVGKAKSLKARVSSYFNAQGQIHFKTRALVDEIYDVDVIITSTEVESLLLERTLIKHHKPRYNINLKDDKEYPYLRVDFAQEWPRIEKVRRRKDDGARYLGPFGSAGQLRILLNAVYRIFPLIRCSKHEFANAKRPCNYYHMKMCLGPCTLPVEKAQYKEMVSDALDFLAGRNKELVRALKTRMETAAEGENYELAALLRDQLKAFESVTEKQVAVVSGVDDVDAIGFHQTETRAAFTVIQVREGKIVAQDGFTVQAPATEPDGALVEFLLMYYDGRTLPDEILVPLPLPDVAEILGDALLQTHPDRKKIQVKHPDRGARRELVEIAAKNAAFRIEEEKSQGERRRIELEVVKDKLKLKRLPTRMECIDISNIQGTAIVAANVVFVEGKPAKELYRHYVVNEVTGGPDDFASIREVVRRRLERAQRDGDTPDLLIIDGGKGQLSAAGEALLQVPGLDFELVSIAKSRVDKKRKKFIDSTTPERSFERIFFPDRETPIALAPGTPEFRLLTSIRDEAHRFAITHHRKRRGKLALGSSLLDIPGIGAKLRQRLLMEFGGLEGLRRAPLEQLIAIKGLKEEAAVTLHASLHADEAPGATAMDDGAPAASEAAASAVDDDAADTAEAAGSPAITNGATTRL